MFFSHIYEIKYLFYINAKNIFNFFLNPAGCHFFLICFLHQCRKHIKIYAMSVSSITL